MRKKLLRSGSGFEKPESREEAIMQNILGASNVLDPAESNIEEILQAILYNTPYTKEAEFEIEKILLAIKNNGTYDGEGESRDMRILIAILNGLDYTEGTESRIEELFVEWLHQRSNVNVLEGVPPLTFVAKGNPLINYEISGNTVQSGTPTPDSPVMPQGTGERTGNLAPPLTEWVDGYVSASGAIAPPTKNYKEKSSDYIPVKVGREYTFSVGNEFPGGTYYPWRAIGWYTQDKTFISRDAGNAGGALSTSAPSNAVYCRLSYRTHGETTNPMLNLGSTPLPYEPYGIKIPISSASTTTPVYLGEVQTTRKIKKLVLTGEENWRYSTSSQVHWIENVPNDYNNTLISRITTVCTHYRCIQNNTGFSEMVNGDLRLYAKEASPIAHELYIKDNTYTTAEDFKTYLAQQYAAGTPVTVWYVLATEETAVVNEPLMRIGDYSDTLSMEQAGAQIPTNNGTTVIDVDTTVKPSNIYIEYK